MRGLILFLALCSLTAAMVPRARRDAHYITYCEPTTICGWDVYAPNDKSKVEQSIINAYCKCKVGTSCLYDEVDVSSSAHILRCKKEVEGDTEEA